MVTSFLLATVLTCNQLISISDRVVRSAQLSVQQKVKLFLELRKEVSNCPVYIDPLDSEQPIKLLKK